MNNIVFIKYLLLIFSIVLISSCTFSQNRYRTQNNNDTSSIILPLYEIKDSSILDIMKLTSCYNDKLFGKNSNSLWIFDFIIKRDSIYYTIKGIQWQDLTDVLNCDKEDIGIGFCHYGEFQILIREPSIFDVTEFAYQVDDIFVKTDKKYFYKPVNKDNTDMFDISFKKTSNGFKLIEAIFLKNGKIKKLSICK